MVIAIDPSLGDKSKLEIYHDGTDYCIVPKKSSDSGLPFREKALPSNEKPSGDDLTKLRPDHIPSDTATHAPAPSLPNAIKALEPSPVSIESSDQKENILPAQSLADEKPACRKRSREDDMHISPQRGQKRPVVGRERWVMERKRDLQPPAMKWREFKRTKFQENEAEDSDSSAYNSDGQLLEKRKESIEQLLLWKGRKSSIWKVVVNVKSESISEVTAYVSKKYAESKTNGSFKAERCAYELIRKVPNLQAHTPKYIGCYGVQILLELIYGQPMTTALQFLAQTVRVKIARCVKKIVVQMHEAGLVHNQIVPENVMIRDGIETCDEDDFDRHVVLVGFSRALSRRLMENEGLWKDHCERDLIMADKLLTWAMQGSRPTTKKMEVLAEKPYEKWGRLLNDDWVREFPRGMPFSMWKQLEDQYEHWNWDDTLEAEQTGREI